MSDVSALAPLLAHLRREPSRTWSLIVTLYGDAVLPRGGRLWLGTLIEILAAMQITGNVVRTAVSRLAADGWLERSRVGRNSYYSLAEKGRDTFAEAAARIYGACPQRWDGAFRIAITRAAERDPARAAIEAAGFAPLSPGVFVAVSPRPGFNPPPDTILLRAIPDGHDARRLAAQIWPTERLAESYRRFLIAFAPWGEHLGRPSALSDLDALVARLLLIHEYRRLVLRDKLLPEAVLPQPWPGSEARALCARLYPALLPASERWLDAHGMDEAGKLPPAPPSLWDRFRPSPQADDA